MSEQTGANCSHWVQVQWPYRGFDSGLWFHCCSLCGHITDQDGNAVKIDPADAVVVTPEIAAVAAESCENRANSLDGGLHESGWSYGAELTARIRRDVERYRAAAAALRGEG